MPAWQVRVASLAQADLDDIFDWTTRRFGAAQAELYGLTLLTALDTLENGPRIIGVKKRDDIGRGMQTLHVALNGRRGRYFILFRAASEGKQDVIHVLRILHDAMDLPRHFADDESA